MSTNNIKLFGNTPLESASNYLSDFVKGKLIIAKDMNLALRNATIGSYTFFNILKDYGNFTIGPELTNDEINTQTTKIKKAFEDYVDNLIENKVADDYTAGSVSTGYDYDDFGISNTPKPEGTLVQTNYVINNTLSSKIEQPNKLVSTPCRLSQDKRFPMPNFMQYGAVKENIQMASGSLEFTDTDIGLYTTGRDGRNYYVCNGKEKKLIVQMAFFNRKGVNVVDAKVKEAIDNMGVITFNMNVGSVVKMGNIIGTAFNGYMNRGYQQSQEVAFGTLSTSTLSRFRLTAMMFFTEKVPVYPLEDRNYEIDCARATNYKLSVELYLETIDGEHPTNNDIENISLAFNMWSSVQFQFINDVAEVTTII